MAVLVTGGAGYIGSHTVRLLAQQQREVVVLDSLELGTKSRIGSVPFFEGNISDEKLIEKICKSREQITASTTPMGGAGGVYVPYPIRVTVGGATVFVLEVSQFLKV